MTGTLVLGVGNVLLADEGAGVHAMRYLEKHYDLHDVRYIDAGTLSFTLASEIADADHMIVFDAAQLGITPGGIKVLENEELEGYLPERYALIGIQPDTLGWGEAPSETVRRSLPRAAANAAALVHKWRRTDYPRAVNQ